MMSDPSRRRFLLSVMAGAVVLQAPRTWAQVLTPTPRQTEGPFYPDTLPLDRDNDLIIVNRNSTPARGEVTQLTGRVLDPRGRPIKNAVVEIWQVDANGVYLHSADTRAKRDANFQGYGSFETNTEGGYRFRTIKPATYPGRTPHIHVKVSAKGQELLTTQLYVAGHPQNERDGVLARIRDPNARAAVLVPFVPRPGSSSGELMARFDIVLGITPAG